MSRIHGLLATLALLMLAFGAGAAPSTAGGGGPTDAATGRLLLLGQSAPVALGGRFSVSVNTTAVPAAVDVVLRVHRPVNGRIQLDASITGERLGSVQHTAPPQPVTQGQATVRLDLGGDAADGLDLRREGVYPVSITARDTAGAEVAVATTHLVLLPPSTDTSPPLLVAVVVPLGAPPSLRPDGGVALAPSTVERLAGAAAALAAHPGVPATLEVVPETLRALELSEEEDERAIIDELAASREDRPLLRSTFVRLDMGAWLADGLDEELASQRTAGRSVLERLLGGPFDDGTAIVDRTTSSLALEQMLDHQVRRLVTTDGWVDRAALPEDGLQRGTAVSTIDDAIALVPNPAIHAHLADAEDPIRAAHTVIAELMVRYFELPGSERGEVLLVPDELAGAPGFLDALLEGLDRNPRLAPVTVDELVTALPIDPAATPLDVSVPAAGTTGSLPDDLAGAAADAAAFRSMRSASVDDALIDELLLVAGSSELRADERAGYLRAASTLLAAEAAGLHAPEGQTVTLTAQRADIPLTIESTLDHDVRVRLRFDSDKLEFPDGDEQVVTLAPGVTRLEVTVRSRATGAFPLRVALLTPERDVALSSTRMNIRSTAISGVGLVLSIGAGLFLALWWIRHWRDARRSRRLVSPSHPAVGGGGGASLTGARRLLEEPPPATDLPPDEG